MDLVTFMKSPFQNNKSKLILKPGLVRDILSLILLRKFALNLPRTQSLSHEGEHKLCKLSK